jgi:hypothetical protein
MSCLLYALLPQVVQRQHASSISVEDSNGCRMEDGIPHLKMLRSPR